MKQINTYPTQRKNRRRVTETQRYIAVSSVLFSLFILLLSSYLIKQQQRHTGRAQQALPKSPAVPMITPPPTPITFPLTPTHYCLGTCPTTTIPTLSSAPTGTPAPFATPTVTQPTNIPTPTIKRQAPTSTSLPNKEKGFLELILSFLKAILEMIQKLFH
jgi:hypothetical protein